jgi:hypothetical protein
MDADRQHAHELIDLLPPAQVAALVGLLETIANPTLRSFTDQAIEDEEISPEEQQSVERSKEWFRHNRGTPIGDLAEELGLSIEEIRNHRLDDDQSSAA